MSRFKREAIERFVLTGVLSTIALSINTTWGTVMLLVVAFYSLVTGIVWLVRKP